MTSSDQVYTTSFLNFATTWEAVRNRRRPFGVSDVTPDTGLTHKQTYRHLFRLVEMDLLTVQQLADRTENIFSRPRP